MKEWNDIRRRVLVEGESKRQVLRETGMHHQTLEKILTHSQPPGYWQSEPRKKTKLGPYTEFIERTLKADPQYPKKQRHTAKRLLELIREQGYTGGYTVVKDFIQEYKRTHQEVFMPLRHIPGEAQVDYFEALVRMGGVLRKVHVFMMALPHSDAFFVKAYERECWESFADGHLQAFRFFGGVPRRITYDNTKIAVRAIVGAHKRKETDNFLALKSHYLFESHFCTVRRPNEKGVVEVTVKYARLNFFVPVPQVRDYDELNVFLEACCRSDMKRRLRGKGAPKSELLKEDQAAFLEVPPGIFEACRRADTRSDSLSLVRFHDNDYSVPVRYAHHKVVVKGFVDTVQIFHASQQIAVHKRLWEKEKIAYEPVHYLPLLEKKPGALDYSQPLSLLELPECFHLLRRRFEHEEPGGPGIREYIRILRLLEQFTLRRLSQAVEKALRTPTPTADVVRLYLYPDEPVETFNLDGREYLKGVTVASPSLASYGLLLERRAHEQ